MKTENILIIAGVGLLAYTLFGKQIAAKAEQVSTQIGKTVGGASGGVVAGAVEGIVTSTLINPYDWAKQHEGYIPVVDDVAYSIAYAKAGMQKPAGEANYAGVLKDVSPQATTNKGVKGAMEALKPKWYNALFPVTYFGNLYNSVKAIV